MSDLEPIIPPIKDTIASSLVPVLIFLLIVGVSVGLAFIPATIAKKKGYSYGGFFVLGLFFFLIGLIVVLCLDDKNARANQVVSAVYPSNSPSKRNVVPSVADELQKLNNLRQQGAISQEEYDRLKSNLLNQ